MAPQSRKKVRVECGTSLILVFNINSSYSDARYWIQFPYLISDEECVLCLECFH